MVDEDNREDLLHDEWNDDNMSIERELLEEREGYDQLHYPDGDDGIIEISSENSEEEDN